MYSTQVPSSWRSTRWLSQIFSNSVRGTGGGGGGVADFLRNAMVRLLLSAALGVADGLLFLRLFLLELLAARTLESLLGLHGDELALGVGVLGDATRLAAHVAQVIELGAAHDALTDDFDFPDAGTIEREHALHAFAEGNLAHGERRVHAVVLAGDAQAFVDLQTLAGAFLNLDVHLESVARFETGNWPLGLHFVDRLLADRVDNVNLSLPFVASIFVRLLHGPPAFPQIGPPPPRDLFPLLPPPFRDPAVV